MKKMIIFGKIRKIFIVFLLIISFGLPTMVVMPTTSEACCSCERTVRRVSNREWRETKRDIKEFIEAEFTAHRIWMVQILWEDNILPAMMLMAEQLSVVAMQQTQIIGSFLDAKQQMETQQTLQEISARIHKDYHPSIGMCEFGSTTKSLAASERKSEINAFLLSQRSQDRQLANAYTASSGGPGSDMLSRLRQFRNTYCDLASNNEGMDLLCERDGGFGAEDSERINKDIDYSRTVEWPWTLNVDYTDTVPTDDEADIMALSANLYSHDVFVPISPASALAPEMGHSDSDITPMQKLYMDMRSIVAKRSVAENSFNAITAMKSQGTPGSREYLMAVLEELGVNDQDDISELLGGDNISPSYYAQMEVLTKKVFQNPDFYTHLYDKPVNVKRKGVAIQAIGLMQKFDLFKSYLRNEANLSILLELAVSELQDELKNKAGLTEALGTEAR